MCKPPQRATLFCMVNWARRYLFSLAFGALAVSALSAPPVEAAASAVIIMYHRFGEEALPSTNIRYDQFEAQLAELVTGGYSVLPLPDIIAALRAGAPLPDKTIGITVDDAYSSVYEQAWPRLKAAGFPFTLFVSTDPVDGRTHGIMSWDQIRELADDGVTIGHHGASHAHMAGRDETLNAADIAKATGRFRAELGRTPELFAYPYGESSLELQGMIAEAGFIAAFGQQSGVAHDAENIFVLPRFALNENYAGMARFRLAVNALALPVTDITPADPLVTTANPPAMGFTMTSDLKGIERLSCFTSHAGRARVERLGQRRIEVRVDAPFPKGRTRMNCTLPGAHGRWHWLGRQFYRPE